MFGPGKPHLLFLTSPFIIIVIGDFQKDF